jgi:hypothetical protein
MMLAPMIVGGIGTFWIVYSKIIEELMKPCSLANTILSQIRMEGNMTLAISLIDQLPRMRRKSSKNLPSEYSVRLWGSTETVNTNFSTANTRMVGRNMIVCMDENGGCNIFSNQKVENTTNTTIMSLVQSKRLKGGMICEPYGFYTWMRQLDESHTVDLSLLLQQQQQKQLQRKQKQQLNVSGTYRYVFRDYWNFEESLTLAKRLGSIRILKLRGQKGKPTELILHRNGSCTLTDFYVVNNFVPMTITWEGRLINGTISWYRTFIRKGWKWWGMTIDRPYMAERNRQQPWKVSLPLGSKNGGVLILERKCIGRLVFVRG